MEGEDRRLNEATPPYPAETRCKGWRFELDHERIRQSDTWALAPAELRPWLLMLWMVAWEQTPCGALPNSDDLIAARIGMKPAAFKKAREFLMRGWALASDGRLYHAVMVERVQEMMRKRRSDSDRQATRRARTHEDDNVNHVGVTRDTTVTPLGLTRESSTGTGTSKEEEKKPTPSAEEIFWTEGPKFLAATGTTNGTARTFLGSCVKSHGIAESMRALEAAMSAQTGDPRAYMKAILEPRNRNTGTELRAVV